MQLAKHAGIDIPDVEMKSFEGIRAFVIDRFDRKYNPESDTVMRRHVIDGCQAVDLPPAYKYERQHGDESDGIYIRDGVSFPKLFAIQTINQDEYRRKLIEWMTFNIITRNYDAHGKNISFFVRKEGIELAPFYDLVNIEAILRGAESIKNGMRDNRENSAPQYFAMSVGEYESATAGNFLPPITAYMLADFANEFDISLPRMQMLMTRMIGAVRKSLKIAKEESLKYQLTPAEVDHIDLCIEVVNETIAELLEQVSQSQDMDALL